MVHIEHDAGIVGTGLNCLACNVALVENGWSVLLLEQSPVVGGAVRAGGYAAPGFHHDWAAMNLSLFANSTVSWEFFFEPHDEKPRLVKTQNCFASFLPNGSRLGVSADQALNEARIATFSKADRATWSRISRWFERDEELLFQVLGSPMILFANTNIIWRSLRRRGLEGGCELFRFLSMSSRARLNETFEAPEVRATFGVWGMHLDFAADIADGAVFPILEAMTNQAGGMVLGKGGAGTVTDGLVSRIELKGGEVRCGAKAVAIDQIKGKATGVVLADGTRVRAKRAVIGNMTPARLAELICSSHPDYAKGLSDFVHAPGLRDRVIARRVVTRADLERDNPKLVGGDQICGSHHLSQNFLFRPLSGHSDGSTPIEGLYHTGAAVWPGAGNGVGPGYLLAKRLTG